MKNVILLLSFLVSFSCSAQNKAYTLAQVQEQNQEISRYFNSSTKTQKTVKDIVKHLNLKIISYMPPRYGIDNLQENLITLEFYDDSRFEQLLNRRKLKYYRINLYLEENPPKDKTIEITRRNEMQWTKEVEDFFGKYVVDSIDVY